MPRPSTTAPKKRRLRSPHPGIVIVKPDAEHPHWRARFVDPDSGRTVKVRLDPVALTTAAARREWAIAKSKNLAKRRMELEAGAPIATGTSLDDAVKRYYVAHPHLSARSKLDYGAATQKLLTWAAKYSIRSADDLTRARLMAFREELIRQPKRNVAKGKGRGARQTTDALRAPQSINGELRKVRTVLGYLRKIDLLPRLSNDDLRDGLQRLPVTTERIDFLKPAECQNLLEAGLRHDAETFAETREEHAGRRKIGSTARYDPIAPFTAFVLLTGMRLNEAVELDWKQVDLDALDYDGQPAGEIHLAGGDTKTKHARTVALEVSTYLRKMLAAMYLAQGRPTRGSVFGLSEGVVEASAKRLRTTYGAPSHFTWQMLRRTCGTYLTNAPGIFGASSAYRSAKQLGHSVQVAEKHYVGLIRGIPRDARTLEGAMQLEDVMARVFTSASPRAPEVGSVLAVVR